MFTPYQALTTDARKEVVRRKTYYAKRLQQCEEMLRTLDALPSFFAEYPVSLREQDAAPAEHAMDAVPQAEEETPVPAHRRKEDLYDEEMRRLLARIKVATKKVVFQHFHTALRGNTSIGAVESYLKRAALRGVIVRHRRGEYTLPMHIG